MHIIDTPTTYSLPIPPPPPCPHHMPRIPTRTKQQEVPSLATHCPPTTHTRTHAHTHTHTLTRTKQKEVLEAVTSQCEEMERKVHEQEVQVRVRGEGRCPGLG